MVPGGRGQGVSADREAVARGRGVSQERGDGPAQGGERAYHVGSTTGPVGTDTLSSASSSTHLGSEGSASNSTTIVCDKPDEALRKSENRLIMRYYHQLRQGCGRRCDNPLCFSSGAITSPLAQKAAADNAILCTRDNARLCSQSVSEEELMQIILPFEDFIVACFNGENARVEQMVRDKPEFLNHKDGVGRTGLMWAIANKRTETLKLLLSMPDVDLSLQSILDNTAIPLASHYNSVNCLKLLLLHPKCSQAIVEMKNTCQQTAEMIAKSRRYTECEKLLKSFNQQIMSTFKDFMIADRKSSVSLV